MSQKSQILTEDSSNLFDFSLECKEFREQLLTRFLEQAGHKDIGLGWDDDVLALRFTSILPKE